MNWAFVCLRVLASSGSKVHGYEVSQHLREECFLELKLAFKHKNTKNQCLQG